MKNHDFEQAYVRGVRQAENLCICGKWLWHEEHFVGDRAAAYEAYLQQGGRVLMPTFRSQAEADAWMEEQAIWRGLKLPEFASVEDADAWLAAREDANERSRQDELAELTRRADRLDQILRDQSQAYTWNGNSLSWNSTAPTIITGTSNAGGYTSQSLTWDEASMTYTNNTPVEWVMHNPSWDQIRTFAAGETFTIKPGSLTFTVD